MSGLKPGPISETATTTTATATATAVATATATTTATATATAAAVAAATARAFEIVLSHPCPKCEGMDGAPEHFATVSEIQRAVELGSIPHPAAKEQLCFAYEVWARRGWGTRIVD